jgi:sigma-B regulation protein RsbU (phosphoserine phosphatase)
VDYVYAADIRLDYIYAHLHATLAKTVAAGVVISVVSMWLTWLLARHISGPMARLASVIRAVVGRDFHMAKEEHTVLTQVAERAYNEVSEVAVAFCRLEDRLESYLVELQHTTAERERIASELSIAHDIQVGLLPRTLPRLDGCDVFGRVIPAKEVGGDLFEVAALDEHRLLLVVADVSGKGVSGGMFMAVTKTLLDVARNTCSRPDELIRFLNDHLSAENEACMFVTMFVGIFDARTGWLHYTNAGHNPPYLLREDGKLNSLTERHGMALGIAAGQPYGSDVVKLEAGDLLVMYSDGITEAQDVSEALFSEERLETCLHELTSPAAEEAAGAIIDRVAQFQGAAPQFDDITLVTLHYTAPVAAAAEEPVPALQA